MESEHYYEGLCLLFYDVIEEGYPYEVLNNKNDHKESLLGEEQSPPGVGPEWIPYHFHLW